MRNRFYLFLNVSFYFIFFFFNDLFQKIFIPLKNHYRKTISHRNLKREVNLNNVRDYRKSIVVNFIYYFSPFLLFLFLHVFGK